jgi:hypothetical protein
MAQTQPLRRESGGASSSAPQRREHPARQLVTLCCAYTDSALVRRRAARLRARRGQAGTNLNALPPEPEVHDIAHAHA